MKIKLANEEQHILLKKQKGRMVAGPGWKMVSEIDIAFWSFKC